MKHNPVSAEADLPTIEKYQRAFTHLNRAPGRVWTPATKKKAPHKPLLLLALLDLFAQGHIQTNFIELTPDLSDLFTLYWSCIIPLRQKSSVAFPFFHLKSEGFWHLVPVPGKEQVLASTKSISTVGQLRDITLGARLDNKLSALLQNESNRESLRAALITTHFSEEVRPALIEQGEVNAEAFDYSLRLYEKAHGKIGDKEEKYKPAVRDQGFRRAIVNAYDHRCALCGIRMVTPDGHTVVDAAHIVSWSESHNDNITNGMALCRLCHWTFDEGMIGVRNDYTVITSPLLVRNTNVPGFLLNLADRPIIGPPERDLWPARESLAHHRKRFRLRS
jgi:putative restriction endonuclease